MAAASPPPESEIKVYTPLPLDVQFGDNLQGHHTDRRWVHCLNIPTKKLNALQFSHRPYKWIRYATGVVLGAEGVLSTSPDSPTPVEDSIVTVLPAETSSLYYHISNEEEQRMFPVDPRIGRTRVTSSAGTSRRTDFRIQVARRDGNRCVLTRSIPRACQAVHLLSHSKGDTVC
ncbi:hypothetical protein FIBSPDRAFT_865632 [Athelia psychrophila]|uniref:HNH nuclease domain-containing protein n=1 Tax=Athelia psychrophila TaxID=1759441 RepID=A0A166FCZ7_9AGAM|nr:hypothetical protein FIBSPDRAFT_865632 [Fibularhizoctonia sp. CBS 109695]